MKKVFLGVGAVISLTACGNNQSQKAVDSLSSMDSTTIITPTKADSLARVQAETLAMQAKKEEGKVWLQDFIAKYYQARVSLGGKDVKLRQECLTESCRKKYDEFMDTGLTDMIVGWQDPAPSAKFDVQLASDSKTYDVTITSGIDKIKLNVTLDLSGDAIRIADVKEY